MWEKLRVAVKVFSRVARSISLASYLYEKLWECDTNLPRVVARKVRASHSTQYIVSNRADSFKLLHDGEPRQVEGVSCWVNTDWNKNELRRVGVGVSFYKTK